MLRRFTVLVVPLVILLGLVPVAGQSSTDKALVLYQQGKYAESIELLEELLKTEDNNPKVWNALGLNYLETGDLKKAKKAFKKAVKLAPDAILYRGNLALLYMATSEFEDAEDELKELMKLEPNDATTHYFRGTARLRNDDYEGALEDADRALALTPEFAVAANLKMDAVLTGLIRKPRAEVSKEEIEQKIASARRSLQGCLVVCPETIREEIKSRLSSLAAFDDVFMRRFGESNTNDLPHGAVVTDLKVTRKPRPGYTDAARSKNESGTVILLVEFRDDGTIGYVAVSKALRFGLTERAIRAARLLEFEPPTVDGKPYSIVKEVHYFFTIR